MKECTKEKKEDQATNTKDQAASTSKSDDWVECSRIYRQMFKMFITVTYHMYLRNLWDEMPTYFPWNIVSSLF